MMLQPLAFSLLPSALYLSRLTNRFAFPYLHLLYFPTHHSFSVQLNPSPLPNPYSPTLTSQPPTSILRYRIFKDFSALVQLLSP